jgi:class 3 adenylate cyclase
MSGERAERRLAAILAADIAGYSRLMGADEEGTLTRLKALRRELIDRKIATHRGRLVKTTGDGLLVEFASVVDALRCATEVQQAMAGRNAGSPPRNVLNSALVSIKAISSWRRATSLVTGSTSLLASKPWRSRPASVSRRECRRTPPASSTWRSMTSASTA